MDYKKIVISLEDEAKKQHLSIQKVRSLFSRLVKIDQNNYGVLFSAFKPIIVSGGLVLASNYENNSCVDDLSNGNIDKVVEGEKIVGIRTFSKRRYNNGESITHYPCTNEEIKELKKQTNRYGEVSIEEIPDLKNLVLGAYKKDNPIKNSHGPEHAISCNH